MFFNNFGRELTEIQKRFVSKGKGGSFKPAMDLFGLVQTEKAYRLDSGVDPCYRACTGW